MEEILLFGMVVEQQDEIGCCEDCGIEVWFQIILYQDGIVRCFDFVMICCGENLVILVFGVQVVFDFGFVEIGVYVVDIVQCCVSFVVYCVQYVECCCGLL